MEETKKPAKRPTPRQRKAALEVVKNLLKDEPDSVGQVLENIGYSKGVSETPNMVLNSEGFKLALEESGLKKALIRQGITPNKIADKINVLLEAKREDKPDYQAIDKGISHATKIYGILDETPKTPTGNTYNFIFSEEARKEVERMDSVIKVMLTKKPDVPTN